MHLPGKLCFPLIKLGARVFGHFNLTADSPVKAVKKTRLPLLIIHGTADTFVPYQMSEKIFEAAAPTDKKLLLFKGAYHGISYMNNEKVYIGELRSFMERIFK
jgi:dipeptidyl aminopeptidase/acylaminoacyl peptidase